MLKTSIKDYVTLRKAKIKETIERRGWAPELMVIQVGDDPASNSYIAGKKRDCAEVGIEIKHVKLPADITERELCEMASYGTLYGGTIVQLPLPDHIDAKNVTRCIPLVMDVDGFRAESPFEPCTPLGIINYLKYNGYQFEGKDALVIGRSDIVGKPLARMLTDLDCTVTLAHSKTHGIIEKAEEADIVFTCIDKVEHFDAYADFLLDVDIVDIGLGRNDDGKLVGNLMQSTLDLANAHAVNGRFIISGTGGVGLLTRLALMENVCKAAFDEDVP